MRKAYNAVVTQDPAGLRKLDKSRARARIDGAQALMMAVGLASRTAVKPVLDFSDMVILA
jgi:phage terminase large subunit-like protein